MVLYLTLNQLTDIKCLMAIAIPSQSVETTGEQSATGERDDVLVASIAAKATASVIFLNPRVALRIPERHLELFLRDEEQRLAARFSALDHRRAA